MTARVQLGPWLWSPTRDLAVFGGSALVAAALVLAGPSLGLTGELGDWGWLVLVVGIDVAHVWSTIFRTYLDGEELRAHPLRYALVPVLGWAAGAALHLAFGAAGFWRVLAYLALFHFVRQQVGWVALYRAKDRAAARADAWIDGAAVYLATLYPVTHWHAHLASTRFSWFVHGDFVDVSRWALAALPAVRVAWLAALATFALRQLVRSWREGRFVVGKAVVVASTALVWWLGIVATNDDARFTVSNVIVHGVPYAALLWAYARARAAERPGGVVAIVAQGGVTAFFALLVALALAEELLWDRWVWHDRPWLFGHGTELGPTALALLVPLLAAPQATHYLLDGWLWRRGETRARPAQRAAIGL